MSALDGISRAAKIALIIAGLVMFTFFTVQTCVVLGFCENTYFLALFGYSCVILFMPPFFLVVKEFLKNKAVVSRNLQQKNTYLEHAAKIIRHDMHSGINTYLPRGIKSLKRRLSGDQIKELKIQSPLKLIEDGLAHAQKVYTGVYEFTNLVKNDSQMSKVECNVGEVLDAYLKLTAYKNQVLINDNLPKKLKINEALFCTAVDNLIRNGLKYNDSATKWVKVYYEEDKEGSYVCVQDNGRGLSSDDFWRLAKPYVRKDGQSEQGSGLGLNICIEIIKQHGFKIVVDEIENGTKIKIKI